MGHYQSELNENIFTKLFLVTNMHLYINPKQGFKKLSIFSLPFWLQASRPEAVVLALLQHDNDEKIMPTTLPLTPWIFKPSYSPVISVLDSRIMSLDSDPRSQHFVSLCQVPYLVATL